MINHLKWQANSLVHLIGLCKVFQFILPYYAQYPKIGITSVTPRKKSNLSFRCSDYQVIVVAVIYGASAE